MWDGMANSGWWWGAGLLHMLLYWGVIIAVIVLLVKWLAADGTHSSESGETPLQILKKRYARGEIGKEEFEQRKRDIEA